MALLKGHKTNFNTMLRAGRNGDLALMECTDAVTGNSVTVICMVGRDKDEFVMTPVAKMFDGNPYEEVRSPV